MTDNNHPITPPPELVEEWRNQAPEGMGSRTREMWIATQAARWGAEQELEACCSWLVEMTRVGNHDWPQNLRSARRPKPPSLKEQALAVLDDVRAIDAAHYNILRNALEALPND